MKYFIYATLIALTFVQPTFAGKPSYAKHDSHHAKNTNNSFVISNKDRSKILSYLQSSKRNCPPGLAKKHNGCLPPGQAKRYQIGQHLTVDARTLPQKLMDILSPPPRGTFYRMVDNDVILVSQENQQIMDAVSLISEMSK